MKIALLGYGKMGKLCEQIALSRCHKIEAVMTSTTDRNTFGKTIASADVIIDFSHPECAVDNILMAAAHKKNIVVGTTGWTERLPEISQVIETSGIGFLHAPNFSTGVALFNILASQASQLFEPDSYDAAAIEIHHSKKVDAPSGTAKALAEAVEQERGGKKVPISSVRVGNIPGTHTLIFSGPNETITITHEAHSRTGFAEGAIDAAEWLKGKSGLFTFWEYFMTKWGNG
jgi:4-hydroxy-tetrahydrodipicolinate reductase